jgi:uncharacterized membrane protein
VTPDAAVKGVLAIVVLIRTFLNFSLETEISGTLPWRRGGKRQDPPA